jgi:muramoyltetrapeptide carboxypeptidase
MLPEKICYGDTIGIIAPCHIAVRDKYTRFIAGIRALGFNIKEGKNLYNNTYGFAASEQERADDFNEMVADDNVKMILFGGGEVCIQLLPYIDYESIRRHPKIICSYSDGTTILNAIYAQTGLVVYYGQFPGMFAGLSHYDYLQFKSHFVDGNAGTFVSNSNWTTLTGGANTGVLIGGYAANIALLTGNKYFSFDRTKQYILFLESYEAYSTPGEISAHLAYIEQSKLIDNVSGLLFGHYSVKYFPELMQSLERFGKKHHIPVAACDDFGHGINHAILPIGVHARLDADNKSLTFHDGTS